MRTYEITAIVAVIILVVLIIYFVSAKGEKKKIVLVNSEGREIAVIAEIANTTATRAKGLMGRPALPENEGMLFVFDKSSYYGFWMFNTTIPLDAIHFSENGTVVDVIQMEPCGFNITRCPTYPPREKSRYILEVNQGFAEKNKVIIGKSKLIIP
jgi:uncharacterized membrane protein (UPF0127 family)